MCPSYLACLAFRIWPSSSYDPDRDDIPSTRCSPLLQHHKKCHPTSFHIPFHAFPTKPPSAFVTSLPSSALTNGLLAASRFRLFGSATGGTNGAGTTSFTGGAIGSAGGAAASAGGSMSGSAGGSAGFGSAKGSVAGGAAGDGRALAGGASLKGSSFGESAVGGGGSAATGGVGSTAAGGAGSGVAAGGAAAALGALSVSCFSRSSCTFSGGGGSSVFGGSSSLFSGAVSGSAWALMGLPCSSVTVTVCGGTGIYISLGSQRGKSGVETFFGGFLGRFLWRRGVWWRCRCRIGGLRGFCVHHFDEIPENLDQKRYLYSLKYQKRLFREGEILILS